MSDNNKRNISPPTDEKTLPFHGAAADEGIVLRGRSKGVGVPVAIDHPGNGGPPSRVISGPGDFRWQSGQLSIIPSIAPEGEEFAITVEQ